MASAGAAPRLPPALQAALGEHKAALWRLLDSWVADQENLLAQSLAELAKEQACLPDAAGTGAATELPGMAVKEPAMDAVVPGERRSPALLDKSPHSDGAAQRTESAVFPKHRGQLDVKNMLGFSSDAPDSRYRFPLAEKIEQSPLFQLACSVIIISNAIFLAASADYYIDNIDDWPNTSLVAIETVFVVLYTLELAVRLAAERLHFFWGNGMSWNWFDLILVLTGVREVIQSFSTTRGGDNFSYLRAMRLLKMLKFLRIVRLLRSFRELRLVLDSILGSLRSLLWSIILIFAMTFMFAVCFLTAAAEYLHDNSDNVTEIHDSLRDYWGSMGTSMISLFQASTGGADWGDIALPLWHVGHHYYAIFCLYIGFFLFVIANSVTSIVVDGMREYSEKDQAAVVSDQLARKEEYKHKIADLYKNMDSDGSGEVSFDEFKLHMGDPLAAAFAESLDLEVTDLEQFFSVLSEHGEIAVDIEAFVVGCIKLRGLSKRMDMIDLMKSHKRMAEEQKDFVRFCTVQFELINGKLGNAILNSSK